jgi:hypothetical protein
MIELKKSKLPESVEVDGSLFKIHTSFKYWLRFLELIADSQTPPQDFDFMYIEEKPASRINGLIALVQFCNPPTILPRAETSGESGEKATDYTIDAAYIYAAFMEMYGIDLVESNLHWYKFQALFKGLHDTKLNEIIGYRLWDNTSGKRDNYTRQMEKLRSAWELPQESDENDEDLKAFEALLNPNG